MTGSEITYACRRDDRRNPESAAFPRLSDSTRSGNAPSRLQAIIPATSLMRPPVWG